MEKKETQMDVMIQETRQYIMDNLTITSMSNEELEDNKLILIDYKTDNVKKIEELIDKYKTQLSIYKKALENSLNRKVDETYICLLNWGQSLIDPFGHFGTPLTKNSHKIYDKQ